LAGDEAISSGPKSRIFTISLSSREKSGSMPYGWAIFAPFFALILPDCAVPPDLGLIFVIGPAESSLGKFVYELAAILGSYFLNFGPVL